MTGRKAGQGQAGRPRQAKARPRQAKEAKARPGKAKAGQGRPRRPRPGQGRPKKRPLEGLPACMALRPSPGGLEGK